MTAGKPIDILPNLIISTSLLNDKGGPSGGEARSFGALTVFRGFSQSWLVRLPAIGQKRCHLDAGSEDGVSKEETSDEDQEAREKDEARP